MAIPSFILPNNSIGLIIGLIICPIIYIVMILLLRTLSHEDIVGLRKLTVKLGSLKKYSDKILNLIDKFSY